MIFKKSYNSLLIALIFLSGAAFAQKDSTSSCGPPGDGCCISKCMEEHGASSFGGPMASFTNTGLHLNTGFGGGGGLMFDCGFFIGGFGKGGSTWMNAEGYDRVEVESGYGGLWIGGHPFKDKVIHPKWSARIGLGGVGAEAEDAAGNEIELMDSQRIFVAEPEAGIGININSFMVLDIGAGYRFVKGMEGNEQIGLSENDLNGFQGTVGVKFGSF